jgi:type II secretory pathway pseudopilin PulG
MAVLLISMSVMAIMMTAVLPTWKQLSRREKEAELVFRGEQYARAIQLFQMKAGPGTLPPTIDILVEQRFLRKKFKDPITNDDFAPIVQVAGATGSATPGVAPAGRQGGAAQPAPAAAGQRGTPGAQPGTTPGAAASGGIMGVTSKSKEQSIRLYKGRNHYNEWQFLPVVRVAAPGAGGAAAPGQRGGAQGGQRGAPGTATPTPFGTGRRGGQPPGPNAPNNPNLPPNPFGPPGGRSGR